MNPTQLQEQFYEQVILPRYSTVISLENLAWFGHDKVGPDAWAHHFKAGGREYALLYEDFPDGQPFNDGLSHQAVVLDGETSIQLRFDDSPWQVPNFVGWFTLFEKR